MNSSKLFLSGILAIILLTELCGAQRSEFLDAHNEVRATVNVSLLTWSDTLANYALTYAQTQSRQCPELTHSHGEYGENLFWGSAKEPEWTAGEAVAAWADEVKWYEYAENACPPGKMCGHYTQIVWRNTTEVGCARAKCVDGADYIICSYNPPGNWIGEYPY